MRILLIGGTGFVGRSVLQALREQGHTLAAFHRGNKHLPSGVEQIRGDRNQLSTNIRQFARFNADVVLDTILSSGHQAREVMAVFRGLAGRVVMLSSIDVYRAVGVSHGTESGPLQETPLTEESELRRNLSPYPPQSIQLMRSVFSWVTDDYDKIPAEREVMNDPQLPGTVLRLPMIYGPGDPLHRLYAIVKRITDGRRHIIFPNRLAGWQSPRGYVLNVATAIALATTNQRATGRVYNICEEPPYSELEWARKIASEMGWDGEFVLLAEDHTPAHLLRPGDAAQHWAASSARIRRELGFKEGIGLEEAIRETIRWELDNPPSESLLPAFDYVAEDAALVAARLSA